MEAQQPKPMSKRALAALLVPHNVPTPRSARMVRCKCGGLVHVNSGETPEQAIARCPANPSGLYNRNETVMEDAPAPTCAVCDQPIVNQDPHTHHDADCPVVAASSEPDNEDGIAAALTNCVCDPALVDHPGCCQVCAALDLVFAP